MTGKLIMQLVALAGMTLTAASCSGPNTSSYIPPPPQPTTTAPVPPPCGDTSDPACTPPAPPAPPPTTDAGPEGTYDCYWTVDSDPDAGGIRVEFFGQPDCSAAANVFEDAVSNAYSITPADSSIDNFANLCQATYTDASGVAYTIYVLANSTDGGVGFQGAGVVDPVCTQLGQQTL
jgi:hypothetical protein